MPSALHLRTRGELDKWPVFDPISSPFGALCAAGHSQLTIDYARSSRLDQQQRCSSPSWPAFAGSSLCFHSRRASSSAAIKRASSLAAPTSLVQRLIFPESLRGWSLWRRGLLCRVALLTSCTCPVSFSPSANRQEGRAFASLTCAPPAGRRRPSIGDCSSSQNDVRIARSSRYVLALSLVSAALSLP